MKFKMILMAGIFILAILTIGAAAASENMTDFDALDATDEVCLESDDSSESLGDGSYYDGDYYVYVEENYTHGERDLNSYELIYMASYCQKNSTIDVLVDDVEKQKINVTDGHFSVGYDENGTEFYIYYKNLYPADLGLDYGSYNLKVNIDGKNSIDTQISLNKMDDFTIWLQNPYYCEQEYWNTPSFLIIDSNNLNTGTVEVYVNGSRKLAYEVTGGFFEEIENCSNKSRYVSPADILQGYGTYNIQVKLTENGTSKTLKNENVTVAEFEPTVNPALEVYFDLYTLTIPADDIAHIYLPREATGNLTISFNNVNETVSYSKGYGQYYMNSWDLNHLGENMITVTYTGDDFGTLTATGSVLVLPDITCPDVVNAGEQFTLSILTHEWVQGQLEVYDYTGDVRGQLLNSSAIFARLGSQFATASVKLSSQKAGINKFYLDYYDYVAGHYGIIREVNVVKNSQSVSVTVPKDVESGSSFNITVNAPACDFTFAQISVDGNASDFIMLENGTATKNISNLTDGYHSIRVFYENGYYDGEKFIGDIYLNTFTVNVGIRTNLTAEDVVFDYNSSGNMIITLKDANGTALSGKTVKITLNGQNYINTTDENGQASLTIDLPAGNYTAFVGFDGIEGYLSSNATAEVTVNRLKTKINVSDISVIAGTSNDLTITLTDSEGNGLADKEVIVCLVRTEAKTTDADGNALVTANLAEGNHSAFVTFNGDANYEASRADFRVHAYRIKSQIIASDMNATYGESAGLKVTLTDANGTGIADRMILVRLGGANSTGKTDENGVASVFINPDAGSYVAEIAFAGDNTYIASESSANVTVFKAASQLTAAKITTTYNVAKDLVINLKDASGKAIVGKSVIVTLNGRSYNKTTDSNGQVRVSSYNLAPKTYSAAVKFEGHANYIESGLTGKLVVVNKASPKITASNKAYKLKTKTKKYTITLKNNKNAVLKNKKVTLKVNKKTYTAKTNSKGKATFKITKLSKKGTYKAVIKYAGDSCYKAVSKTIKITVKK